MSFASYIDANDHLDGTKLRFEHDNDAEPEAREVDRLIKGMLYGSFGGVVSSWLYPLSDPPVVGEVETPEMIRYIAGGLMAAMRWNKVYSMEATDSSSFGRMLYKQMLDLLTKVSTGEVTLYDTELISQDTFSRLDFYPNDETVVEGSDVPLRYFSMEQTF